MLTIYLARHGQTEWNVEGLMQGWGNRELSYIKNLPVEKLFSQNASGNTSLTNVVIKEGRPEIFMKGLCHTNKVTYNYPSQANLYVLNLISAFRGSFHL
ncbi:phosphoglycerate mutase family protein [Bacillus sp. V5-8f]|uniref:phosphoglycerate mutase family protein n=1 Tax=Bacillus sp. V5-8f TaxID=2053044 RepID=UPI000C7644B1|nr:phosphoglycerate mutase family protein [Bacillus sp. V5-8f]PLT33573.1 hypothetical protein CUU64_12890 [Bacillus sp. V5-8f]